MKFSPIIKIIIVAVLSFALLGLFIQFIFSYLNQSAFGPKLTIINFAVPFILTMGIVLFFFQCMFSKAGLRIFEARSGKLKVVVVLVLVALLMGQVRYLRQYFGLKQTLDKVELVKLFPMVVGFLVTSIILISVSKRSTSANISLSK